MSEGYKNPVPHLDGKKFLIRFSMKFDEWIDIFEARKQIQEYIARNGLPDGCIADVTPMSEYR